MSRSKSARLRMSLFASSSLVGTSLLAGVGGLAVTMAPGVAMAACVPTVTGVLPSQTTTYNCTGADAALALTSVNPTDTALVVNFAGEAVTPGGTLVSDATAAQAQSQTFNSVSGTNSTANTAGAGLTLDASTKGGAITLTSTVPITISGSTSGLVTKGTAGAQTLTTSGNITGGTGSAVSTTTTTGAVTLNVNAGVLTNASATTGIIAASGTSGATTINLGTGTKPTTSSTAPSTGVVVGVSPVLANSGTTTALAITATGGGAVNVNIGRAAFGFNTPASGAPVDSSVSQLTSTAVVNGHVDFTGLTAASNTVLVGETLAIGTYQSVWNLGTGTSKFGTGNDAIENRGIINVGVAGATASTVVMNFNGPGANGPAVIDAKGNVTTKGALPAQTGTANSDRIWNRGAQAPSASQNLFTPGTINIVGAGSSLTVNGLEMFFNEGAAYLNIRNTTDLSDFVGSGGSKTVASAQSFAMNPGGTYARDTVGTPGAPTYSQFVLTSGTLPGLVSAAGIPTPVRPFGGVNLSDGDTLDVFATSGELNGNASFTPSPIVGARFLVDFDLAGNDFSKAKADQIWVGNITGNTTVLPRFNGLAAGTAATYNPQGILFATEVSNPAVDPSISVDYQAYLNPRDTTIAAVPGADGDQGLYRAFVQYRQGQGQKSVTAGGNTFTSATPTGGFFLVFLPDTEVYQIANFGRAIQDAVRDSQGVYFTRQADLRDAVGDNIGGGWVKISGNRVKFQNEKTYPFMPFAPAQTRTLWDTYTQTTVDITAGADGSASLMKGKIVAGAAVGYTDSDVRFRPGGLGGVSFGQVTQPLDFIPIYSENRTQLEGYHFGGYASYVEDQFFVDASASYTSLDLHSIFSTLNNAVFTTNSKTWDVQALTGYRFVTDDVFSVEPLLGVQYMRTKLDDLGLGANVGLSTFQFKTVESLRPGVGGRVKVATSTDLYKLNLGLTGMWWKDMKTKGNKVGVISGSGTGATAFSVVDNGGTKDTGQVDVNANLIFANGLSAFVNASARGDSDALIDIGFSAGAKYRW